MQYRNFFLGVTHLSFLLIFSVLSEHSYAEVTIGGGLKTSLNTTDNTALSGGSKSNSFDLNSIRLYVNGDVSDKIKFTFNTGLGSNDEIKVLTAIGRFEISDSFNIWAGRVLLPSSRSNLSGPYHLNNWNFPRVMAYPSKFAGHDNGIVYWGQKAKGQTKWQLGVFDGEQDNDDLLVAGRYVQNFWDPEPGYYNKSTYYGKKNILAAGLTTEKQGDGSAYSADILLEKKLNTGGVGTLESALYKYDGLGGLGGEKSDGHFFQASYLMAKKLGIGRFQPSVRFTKGKVKGGTNGDIVDYNLNYIVKGHNARISLSYQDKNGTLFGTEDLFTLGLQLQMK